jgi:outer membrane murein-binding lipoprotein Lpp
MAKKQEVTGAPKVTSLPLPISDTPLVIDLPDGQKIVIGKMQPGSVIEVATWRGTGRPDSRTNRLMMGMNSGGATNPVTEAETKTESTDANQSKDLKSKAIFTAKKLATQIHTLVSQITMQLKKRKSIATKIQPASEESASALTSASEVDEWLQKVLERSEKRSAKALEKKAPAPKKPVKAVKKSAPKKSKR